MYSQYQIILKELDKLDSNYTTNSEKISSVETINIKIEYMIQNSKLMEKFVMPLDNHAAKCNQKSHIILLKMENEIINQQLDNNNMIKFAIENM